jgi:hypothetical protein
MTVRAINPQKDRLDYSRRALGASVRSALESEMVGFALVAWDARGQCYSSICSQNGPIGDNLIPSYVHDALNRHVTLCISAFTEPRLIDE